MATKKVTKKTTKKVVKKVPKKSTRKATNSLAKKVTKRKTPKVSSDDDRVLVCAPSEHCFWTNDGRILQDLAQLRDVLADMDLDIYGHHVNKEKNDFADWVEDILQDRDCALELRKARKPKTARGVVVRYIKLYIN